MKKSIALLLFMAAAFVASLSPASAQSSDPCGVSSPDWNKSEFCARISGSGSSGYIYFDDRMPGNTSNTVVWTCPAGSCAGNWTQRTSTNSSPTKYRSFSNIDGIKVASCSWVTGQCTLYYTETW